MKPNTPNFKKLIVMCVNEFGGRDRALALSEVIAAKNEEIFDTAVKGNDYGFFRRERIIEAISDFFKLFEHEGIKVMGQNNRSNSYQYVEICTKNFKLMISINNRNTRKSKYLKEAAKQCNDKITPKQLDMFNEMEQLSFGEDKILVVLNIHIHKKETKWGLDFPHADDTKLSNSLAIFSQERTIDECDKMEAKVLKPQIPRVRRPKVKKQFGA